ncbi:MAG: para-aminobenzoate synthetase [Pseudonocardiales bacterium]|jgi:para-aminobenzoate synthetase|uniref:aminodeoxychorismate synthase component I n=1 Tax=Pseudonocardia sp. TaxID=60912 RepID=UPI002631613B|nr:aminodeoxychorismate synthase component I [Pseudonocardia sp.]MCW2717636.1 aminodeoxychorismate synthase, component [Pseudonocardia sp.]MDT7710714.1 para-aminobenzoate synthetase [Pseudonocardiales bacterium]
MRTLIIDNYDSFTYNLAHYLAEINGCEPVVVHNDEPGWTIDDLQAFDNVVVSPGPGHPGREADFGFSREAVLHSPIPLLGVCLGHQGLSLMWGGDVDLAPEPYHGRESKVLHDDTDLFAGLPNPLSVVRYHSLTVTQVPADLEVTARTESGLVMGVRHRSKPYWGVQFHPESIQTEQGMELLRNFATMTREWRKDNPRPASATAPEIPVRERQVAPARTLTVIAEQRELKLPVETAFREMFGQAEHSFWLDSSKQDLMLGRFSILGGATGPLARVAKADVWTGEVAVTDAVGTTVHTSGFYDWLDADLRSLAVELPELPFSFALGWVGYLGYELKAETGGARAHRSNDPDAAMVFADRAIVVDHATGIVHLLAMAEAGTPGDEAAARTWLRETWGRLENLPVDAPDIRQAAEVSGDIDELVLRHDRRRYLELIEDCQRAILAGETYEICLTNMVTGTGEIDPWQAYRYLRRESPAPFAAYLKMADLSVLSTSPERFLSISAEGAVESKPIKGTRPRGLTPEEDQALWDDLNTSEKDRAENLMIVDLVRNDLSVCAKPGSVQVPKIFDIESYATVHQLVSTVRAHLQEGVSAVDCIRAAFPGGSMTGAPKIRTMQIIDDLEAGPRGVYSGALGYLSLTGAADLSIVIRTSVVRGNEVKFGVGGAIIALSDPDGEFEETRVKARNMTRLLDCEMAGDRALDDTAATVTDAHAGYEAVQRS